MVSSTEPDWRRETPRRFWDPSRQLLKSIRDYQRWKKRSGLLALFVSKACVLKHLIWSTITSADIPLNCEIGGGLLIPHPNGIVIHPDTKIGVNCLIHQQVTFGVKRGSGLAPTIGGHVDIGAGAKIIGPIHIGDDVLVGANAVVVKDVESGFIVGGIPAKALGQTNDG